MEKEFYQGAAGVPPPINLEAPSSFPSSVLWAPYVNPEQDHLFYSNRASWEKSTDQFNHFDSVLTSLVSPAPGASNFGFSGDIVELIGKLGNICSDSGEDSPPLAVPGPYIYATNDKISTKPSLLTNPIPRNPSPMVAEFSGDPGFAQRAAKFSRFGTRSFHVQTGLPGLNSSQSTRGANPLLPRVASTPSLNNRNPPLRDGKVRRFSESSPCHAELGNNSQEDSSFSGQIPSGNSRKRKAGTRSKAKEITPSSPSTKAPKVVTESEDNANAKRSRPGVGNEDGSIKGEEDAKAGSPKPPEPSKDYIHVRARRGQATDSHSLAERVRREKISERMKLLQDLVPGCNKVTGKALMLDEIINYVQSLQRQVEFLSMKLSRVDLRPDFGKIESALRKDMFQTSSALAHPVYSHSLHPYDQQPHQSPPLQADPNSVNSGSQCSVDPMGKALSGFIDEALPQLPAACQDDLQSIVQMGYTHNPNHGSIQ